jgi:hypothetical protein
MDRRTATAMSYMLMVNKLAAKHGIPSEDLPYLFSMLAVTAHTTGVHVGAVAVSLMTAPPNIVDSMKAVIKTIKEQVVKMEADPDFMAKIDAKAVEMKIAL